MIKRFTIICTIAFAIGFINFLLNPNHPTLGLLEDEIKIGGIAKLSTPLVIVDARSKVEFEKAHIENAINLSEDSFNSDLGNFLDVWTPESTVLVYCDTELCNSSRSIAKRLKEECEIKNVFILKDDWKKWKK